MKYSKVKKIAKIGKYDFTFKTLWEELPKDLIKRLTAKDLAIIIDIMYQQTNSKNLAEIIDKIDNPDDLNFERPANLEEQAAFDLRLYKSPYLNK